MERVRAEALTGKSTLAFKINCGPCRAKGYYYPDREATCTVCGGSGEVVLDGRAEDYKECPQCDGCGFFYPYERKTCTKCKGKQKIPKPGIGPSLLGEALRATLFKTGDTGLDNLLEAARAKFLHHSEPAIHKEALEKLWDAWERIKTLEPGDKKKAASRLLDKAASEQTFRGVLEKEAKALTEIGNIFHIRHSETSQIPLEASEHVDYLFHRLFALIRLVLRRSGRGG